MRFCNKGVVWADPPVMVKDHIFTFFWTLPLVIILETIALNEL